MTQPIGELSDRMREIFGLVVDAYLERGLPVGSKALASAITLSPASIRGVMQELEERGLHTHPRGNRAAAKGKQSGRTQEIQRLIGRS